MVAFKKRTTRRMPPKTRKIAKLINELASIERRLKNILPEIQTAEMYEIAEQRRQQHHKVTESDDGEELFPKED